MIEGRGAREDRENTVHVEGGRDMHARTHASLCFQVAHVIYLWFVLPVFSSHWKWMCLTHEQSL